MSAPLKKATTLAALRDAHCFRVHLSRHISIVHFRDDPTWCVWDGSRRRHRLMSEHMTLVEALRAAQKLVDR